MGKENDNSADSGAVEEEKCTENEEKYSEEQQDYLCKLAGADLAYRVIKTAFTTGLREIGYAVSISSISAAFNISQDEVVDLLRGFIIKEGIQSSGAPIYCLKQSIVDYLEDLIKKADDFKIELIYSLLIQNSEEEIKSLTEDTTLWEANVRLPSELKLIQMVLELSADISSLPLNYGETVGHIMDRILVAKSDC